VNSVVEAYCPIVKKHMNDSFTEEQKQWQQIRRGRCVHLNPFISQERSVCMLYAWLL
jgi:coproporphyrinogen III oxidase